MRGDVEPMQAVATGETELLQPGQMRAVLVMSSGEQLVLDHETREASEGKGVVIAIDSTGVSYQALDSSEWLQNLVKGLEQFQKDNPSVVHIQPLLRDDDSAIH